MDTFSNTYVRLAFFVAGRSCGQAREPHDVIRDSKIHSIAMIASKSRDDDEQQGKAMRRVKLPLHSAITFLAVVLATVYLCYLTIVFKRKFQPAAAEWDPLMSFRDDASDAQSRAAKVDLNKPRKGDIISKSALNGNGELDNIIVEALDRITEMRKDDAQVSGNDNTEPRGATREVQTREDDHSAESETERRDSEDTDEKGSPGDKHSASESMNNAQSSEKQEAEEQGSSPAAAPVEQAFEDLSKKVDHANVDETEEDDEESDEDDDKVEASMGKYAKYYDTGKQYPAKHVVPLLESTYRGIARSREWWIRKEYGTKRRHDKAMKYVAENQNNITLPSSLKERAPSFLVIGAQKSGTTALRTYLSKHPLIEIPQDVGETHYFDKHMPENASPEQHLDAYVGQFFDRDCRKNESFCIAGENTPIYLYDTEHVPARVKAICPWTKFIVLLRDPVNRAISHCNMLIERKEIKDTFEMRLERDFKWMMESGLISNRTLSHEEELEAWRHYQNTTEAKSRWKKLPIGRGFYELQLRRWFEFFPREQFLILKSEDLDTDRAATMKKVFEFLGVPNHFAKKPDKKIHQRTYSFSAANNVRDFLYEFYRPYNQRLEGLLGPEWRGAWEKPDEQNDKSLDAQKV